MKRRGSWISDRIDLEYRKQKKWDKKIAEDKKRIEKSFESKKEKE